MPHPIQLLAQLLAQPKEPLPNIGFGLTGLDPRFVDDPRFQPLQRFVTPEGQPALGFPNTGESVTTSMDPHIHVSYLADVDDPTLADDMWAVTIGNKQGTSVGDRASTWFVQHSKDIVGDAKAVTPAMINAMRQRILAARYGEVRQTHPGRAGYSPKGPVY